MDRRIPPSRADMVGSLLRTATLKDARRTRIAQLVAEAEFRRIEDDEIRALIRRQEEIGLRAVTDGEFRRAYWDIVLGKDHDDSVLLVETGRAEAFAMDDILLFGLMGNQRNPADWTVVGDSLQVEPYACMLRKDDPQFQALVNGVIGGMMKSGEFEKLYTKWFMSPVPPRNQNLNLAMSKELRENLVAQSDKPAQ